MELDFRKDPSILGAIVDAMGIGVFTVDARGEFIAWSDGAERITGYSADEVRGRPARLLEGPNCKGFGTLSELLSQPDPPAGICNQECQILAKDGRHLHIHGNVRVLREHSRVVGAVGTFADMTSFVQANEKIALLEQRRSGPAPFQRMVGQSEAMREVFRRLRLAAESDVTTLITGESGTGKELAAEAIHGLSGRRDRPLVAINCAAIPEPLLESELFGHVKGAFTGAVRDKPGVFQAADGGTLFLDEIGEVSPAIQVKLLRALQQREVRRVGDDRPTRVDVRLISATNKDLRALIASGEIREDFYYRIRVYEVRLPALRERREDLPLLVQHFIADLNRTTNRHVDGVSRDAMQLLMNYHWPGNIRELRNCIEHAFVTVAGDRISYLDLPTEVRDPHGVRLAPPTDAGTPQEQEERQRIVAALRQTDGNRTRAAEILGISRVTLWKKIARYAIEVPPRG